MESFQVFFLLFWQQSPAHEAAAAAATAGAAAAAHVPVLLYPIPAAREWVEEGGEAEWILCLVCALACRAYHWGAAWLASILVEKLTKPKLREKISSRRLKDPPGIWCLQSSSLCRRPRVLLFMGRNISVCSSSNRNLSTHKMSRERFFFVSACPRTRARVCCTNARTQSGGH